MSSPYIVQQAIGEKPKEHSAEKPEKNPAAVTLGRLGGLKGGKARAEKLSAQEAFRDREESGAIALER